MPDWTTAGVVTETVIVDIPGIGLQGPPGPAGPAGANGAAGAPGAPGVPGVIGNVVAGTGLSGGGSTSTVTVGLATPVSIANGGTSAATAPAALTALGAAPIASPIFTGTPSLPTGTTGVTQAAGTSNTSLSTTAFVQAAARYLNYADNSGFSVNQRIYVTSTALAAGIYGHDRWKAGAGGCTYTFSASSGPSTTITITAGTLQQVIEGASLVGGNYMLSWTGTAQGRVGAGSYAASPVAVAGIVAGANTTIEFNAGTLSQVKFDAGTVPTPWAANSARYDLANCQRFYQIGRFYMEGYNAGAAAIGAQVFFNTTMRSAPTVNLANVGYTNGSGATLSGTYPTSFGIKFSNSGASPANSYGDFLASVDL